MLFFNWFAPYPASYRIGSQEALFYFLKESFERYVHLFSTLHILFTWDRNGKEKRHAKQKTSPYPLEWEDNLVFSWEIEKLMGYTLLLYKHSNLLNIYALIATLPWLLIMSIRIKTLFNETLEADACMNNEMSTILLLVSVPGHSVRWIFFFNPIQSKCAQTLNILIKSPIINFLILKTSSIR